MDKLTDLSLDLTPESPLVLVGAGKMGGAMLSGWLKRGLNPKAVRVIDPAPPEDSAALLARHGMNAATADPSGGIEARVLVTAVKPQVVDAVLPTLRHLVGRRTVILSIAAGTTIATLEAGLGAAPIVRAMPNTPGQIGRGVSVAVANVQVDDDSRLLVTVLLEAMGKVAWVEHESLLDAVTAVSGSGPAYVFLLAEYLADAGVAAGLPPDLAALLARETVAGAGELLHQSDTRPEVLRHNVTSPGGTTEAALKVLMAKRGGLKGVLGRAVEAARKRSEQLGE
jgi:pyrroline-5-carboxylate reductase